jgi:hypothetical protein
MDQPAENERLRGIPARGGTSATRRALPRGALPNGLLMLESILDKNLHARNGKQS